MAGERTVITLRPFIPSLKDDPTTEDLLDWADDMHRAMSITLIEHAEALARLTLGRQVALSREFSAEPTSGLWNIGDFAVRQTPDTTGSANYLSGQRYIRRGWMCKSEGSASASSFVELRTPIDE